LVICDIIFEYIKLLLLDREVLSDAHLAWNDLQQK